MVDFIHKKHELKEPDKTGTYSHKTGNDRRQFCLAQSNIYLVGLRGSGKSSLAKQLAQELDSTCIDLDIYTENRLGASIADYVEEKGWPAFRLIESQVLREKCQDKGLIVATGGGIVLSESNREFMKSTGVVFYLMSSIDLLVSRLEADPKKKQRPEFTDLKLKDEIAQTLQERELLYFKSLDYILQASKAIPELVEDVKTCLNMDTASEERL